MPDSIDLPGPVEGVEEAIEFRQEAARRGWLRLDYAILAAVLVLFLAYTAAFFAFNLDLSSLKRWGYVGVFFISMAGSATIVLPTPSTVAIFSGAVVLDPVLGVPAPVLVGLVAGLGDSLGEFSGYLLGYAGTDIMKDQRLYERFERWMDHNGTLAIFLLSTFPNPFFDLAGTAAGATRMPAARFFLACLGGKIIKDLFLAYGGSFSVRIAKNVL